MKVYILITIFYTIHVVCNATSNETITIEEDDHSLILTDTNWDHAHKLYEYIMVFFYKPECDQCLLSDEIFVYAAKHAKETDHEVKFAFVDISKEKTIAAMEAVIKVPAMRFYRNKTGVDYLRTIGKDELVKWLTERVNYQLKVIDTFEDWKNVLISNPLVAVACILTNSISDVRDFEIVASMHDDMEFRLIKDAEICQKMNLPTNENSLYIYQYDFDILHFVTGALSRKVMNDFIIRHHVPIYSEFSEFIFSKSFVGHYHYFVPIIFKSLPIPLNQMKSEIRKIAKELDGKAIFIHFDSSKPKVLRFLEHLSIPRNDGFRVVESNEHLVNFKPENPLNLNGTYMLTYIQSVIDGLAEPELMASEPIEDWHKHPVKRLTRKTYDQVVMDKTKHVFVILYAPDCRFSREALNLFDQLGEIYKEDSDVILAKLDSTTDELPRIRVRSTPLFYLYTKVDNEMIRFVGERTVENIKKFLETNGKEGNEHQYLKVDHLQHVRLTEKGLVHEDL